MVSSIKKIKSSQGREKREGLSQDVVVREGLPEGMCGLRLVVRTMPRAQGFEIILAARDKSTPRSANSTYGHLKLFLDVC